MSQNLRSINANFYKLKEAMLAIEPDIMCAQEIWKPQASYLVRGYFNPILMCRKEKNGGGTGIWIRNNITFNLNTSEYGIEGVLEYTYISVTHAGKKIGIVNMYRPPNGNEQTFYLQLKKIITRIHNQREEPLLLGDVNLNIRDLRINTKIDTFLSQHLLESKHSEITRPESSTCLDHIYGELSTQIYSTTEDFGISDHTAVLLTIPKLANKINPLIS